MILSAVTQLDHFPDVRNGCAAWKRETAGLVGVFAPGRRPPGGLRQGARIESGAGPPHGARQPQCAGDRANPDMMCARQCVYEMARGVAVCTGCGKRSAWRCRSSACSRITARGGGGAGAVEQALYELGMTHTRPSCTSPSWRSPSTPMTSSGRGESTEKRRFCPGY